MAHNSQQIARVLQQLLRATHGRLGTRWMIVLVVLVGGYLLAEPALESKLGVDLPGVHKPASTAVAEETSKKDDRPAAPSATRNVEGAAVDVPVDESTDLDSVLEEVGRDSYRSETGLLYTRGSVHGHRLKHLMSHAEDDPNRPGQHGVFDETDPAALVQLIDEVYLQALQDKNTRKSTEDRRTVYTIDLGRRVGYIGGESGGRRDHPPARHVRLVLEGERFITAFPVRP